jgi:hypothetical protein
MYGAWAKYMYMLYVQYNAGMYMFDFATLMLQNLTVRVVCEKHSSAL